jgi:hypothetical protein
MKYEVEPSSLAWAMRASAPANMSFSPAFSVSSGLEPPIPWKM